MKIPFFMAKHDHLFVVSSDEYRELLDGRKTVLEYSHSRKVSVGDELCIRAYDGAPSGYEDSCIYATVCKVSIVSRLSRSICNYMFSLRVQLIMF